MSAIKRSSTVVRSKLSSLAEVTVTRNYAFGNFQLACFHPLSLSRCLVLVWSQVGELLASIVSSWPTQIERCTFYFWKQIHTQFNPTKNSTVVIKIERNVGYFYPVILYDQPVFFVCLWGFWNVLWNGMFMIHCWIFSH